MPAGFNRVVYEPEYTLNAARDSYTSKANESTSWMVDALPVGISFWAGPGDEPIVIKVASTYEVATKHRKAPPAFGPPAGRPQQSRPPITQTARATQSGARP